MRLTDVWSGAIFFAASNARSIALMEDLMAMNAKQAFDHDDRDNLQSSLSRQSVFSGLAQLVPFASTADFVTRMKAVESTPSTAVRLCALDPVQFPNGFFLC